MDNGWAAIQEEKRINPGKVQILGILGLPNPKIYKILPKPKGRSYQNYEIYEDRQGAISG